MRGIARKAAACLIALTGFAAAIGAASAADIRALVVGIDVYEGAPRLYGAVEDAHDVHGVLSQLPLTELSMLLNEEASRAHILETLDRYVDESREGDVVLFTYSGHGSRKHVRRDGEFVDYEFLHLSNLAPPREPTELISDTRLREIQDRASAAGVEFVFIADNCHAGGLSRSISKICGATGQVRSFTPPADVVVELPKKKEVQQSVAARVSLFAGVAADKRVPEVAIGGRDRGALSFYFARALEGAADIDEDGFVSGQELWDYLAPNIIATTHRRQFPVRSVGADSSFRLPIIGTALSSRPTLHKARVFLASAEEGEAAKMGDLGRWAEFSLDRSVPADLIWHRPTGTLCSGLGDALYVDPRSKREFRQPSELSEVVQGIRLSNFLTEVAASSNMTLLADDALNTSERWTDGLRVRFRLENRHYPHLFLFGISSLGTIEHMFPMATFGDDSEFLPLDRLPSFMTNGDVEVVAPFGVSKLVAVASDRPMPRLETLLADNDKRPLKAETVEDIADVISQVDAIQVAVFTVVTSQR